MSYAREYQEEHPMQRVASSLREYFDDMRRIRQRKGGDEREHGVYDRHEYDRPSYDRPHQRTMGFNGQRSQGREEEYGLYERRESGGGDYKEFHRHMSRYWRDMSKAMKSGDIEESRELMETMAMVAAEAVRYCMEEKGDGEESESHKSSHKKLEKAVNKIRRAPLQDRNKLMREMFPDLQGAAQRVLQDMVAQDGVEQRARKLNMSEDEYCDAQKKLARMLTESERED